MSRRNCHTGGAARATYGRSGIVRSWLGAGRNVAFSESSRTLASERAASVSKLISIMVAVTQLPDFVNVAAQHIHDVFFMRRIFFQMLLHLARIREGVNLNSLTAAAASTAG